jgi:hypothetical protein
MIRVHQDRICTPLVAESDREIAEAGYLPSQGTIGCEDDEEVGLDSRRSNEF